MKLKTEKDFLNLISVKKDSKTPTKVLTEKEELEQELSNAKKELKYLKTMENPYPSDGNVIGGPCATWAMQNIWDIKYKEELIKELQEKLAKVK